MMEEGKRGKGRRGAGSRGAGVMDRREAAGQVADGLAQLLHGASEPLWDELTDLQRRVREIERSLAALHATGGVRMSGRNRLAGGRGTATRSPGSRRIRWGDSDEEIRQTVLAEAARIQERTGKLDVATLRAELPSVFRFLYGDRAVFAGVKGLAKELGS